MVIDLNVCTGCSACVVACRAENNLPIVGPKEAERNGTFQWMRIDRLWDHTHPSAPVTQRPVLCQQCEAAPCEPVCPVYATYHTSEGLNAQVYNRCVGTRYCAFNCPYDVRYFNWFEPQWPSPMEVQLNPDVSRRMMGVMEKCTWCIQRIQAAERTEEKEKRRIRDGELQSACAQSCPSRAIIFGDLNDAESEVARYFAQPTGTRLLEELGTKPHLKYLARSYPPGSTPAPLSD
jgi:molybdopterin-containing oxidoreductase family iron-sulfur binding subunit